VSLPTFKIARFPVTVAEYACAVRVKAIDEPSSNWSKIDWQTQLQRLDHPVVCIWQYHAWLYARWLAKTTGQPWRLASEAEWEKAARWDPERRSSLRNLWGDTFDTARCKTCEGGIGTTTPVGSYPTGASPCGAQDMAGNVWEWTDTYFKAYRYRHDDGREEDLLSGGGRYVKRGGSWLDDANAARAAFCRVPHSRLHDLSTLVPQRRAGRVRARKRLRLPPRDGASWFLADNVVTCLCHASKRAARRRGIATWYAKVSACA
jgi:formylglycine-generating enzyme required for sulfatase activity